MRSIHTQYVSLSTCRSSRLRLKCDGTRAGTRFRLSAKRTSPFKTAGASVQSTTGSRGVRISGSNVEYTMFRGSMKSTGYPLHSPVSLSLPLPCVTVCHHISTGLCLPFITNTRDSSFSGRSLQAYYLTDLPQLQRCYSFKRGGKDKHTRIWSVSVVGYSHPKLTLGDFMEAIPLC